MRPAIPALTSLRFFAAAWVVAFHESAWSLASGQSELITISPLNRLVSEGALAVNFFFMLSGFILAYSYAGPDAELKGSKRDFWVARISRLWPMYLFGMALDAPFTVQKIWDFHPFIIPTAIRTLIGGVLTAFLLQSWIPPILLLWNPPGWSLSTEACFYALFPMIVLFLLRRSSKALVAILIGAWALSLPTIYFLTTAIPALNTAPPLFDVHGNFRLILGGFPLVRLPEFVIGVCLGSLYLRHGINVHESIIIRAIPASALAVFVLIAAFSGPLYLAITATPLFAALIFSAAMQREGIFTKFLSTPVLLLLGESSYCLYIIHWPIAKWFNVLVGDVSHDFALYFLVVTALSIACFKLIERPMCRSLRSFDKVPKESSKIDH